MAGRVSKQAAGGSGIKEEGKFRQRVDDHYKVMAAAKKSISTAGRLQLASAIGLGTVMGVAATQPEAGSMALIGVGLVLMIYSGVCSQGATAAAGAKDAEKNATAYAGRLRTLALLLVLSAGGLAGAVSTEVLETPPTPLLIAFGGVGALDLIGCLLGLSSSSQLLGAFESQKAKREATKAN